MSLNKAYDFLLRILNPLTRVVFYMGIICLTIMMFLTAVDVIGRYFFNSPILGSFEITQSLMVILMATSIGYCGMMKGHIDIDLVAGRLSQRAQSILGCITTFLGVALFGLITWQTFVYIGDNIASNVASAVLQIPAWPFVLIVAIGSGIFCLVLLLQLLEFVCTAVSK